ncbi:MAG TPA: VOC family protein [Xanthomonadaceae bacterium]|nr:VOC family protein [Xanthomonadaceae bacterium]
MDPGISGIGQIAVNCQDVDRATAFYRDVIGLPLLFESGGMAFFDCGGVRLMLSRPSAPEHDHPASILYLRCTDIETQFRELVERGAVELHAPQLPLRWDDRELWLAFFLDTEGNTMALMEERRAGTGS